jgi:hypothetical protein
MRLTVGPLPATVYWRRRAVVLVGLAMIVLVVSYACGGPDPNADAGVAAGASSSESATPTTTLLRPEVPATTTSAAPSPSAFTLPVPATTGPCTDAELDVVATAAAPEVQREQPLAVTITIKNISTRSCNRDIGADMQELRLNDPATKRIVWSSDDCNPNHGSDDRAFAPGQEETFTLTWLGLSSRGGDGTEVCNAPAPTANTYELVARLDQKYSAPFALRILAGAA